MKKIDIWKSKLDAAYAAIAGIVGEDEIIRSFCYVYKYEEFLEDLDGTIIPNPQTPLEFTKQKILEFIIEVVRTTAITGASVQAQRQADLDFDINLNSEVVDD